VKPWELLERTAAPDGASLALMRRDDEYVIFAGATPLMSSRVHGSEDALATLGCERAKALEAPCVLIGGLGLGFTVRAALDLLPPAASVIVCELVPAVVAWNRGPLGPLAAHPLDDPRVRVVVGDVTETLRASPERFDAVLLDVDNGPDALATSGNAALYADAGLAAVHDSLTHGGVLAVWSAADDRKFARRLRNAGFSVRTERPRRRQVKRGARDFIFLARKTGD
jgi:spermidine synthase